ncbi:MAG: hypothetical protein ABRQ37_14220, partial [Candidatus Eremiobacterota bacterium]
MKFSKTLLNPFDYINPEKIKNRVNTIKDRHPEWEKEDICKELVRQKARLCGTTGAISALPSSLPGIGTFMTLAGGTAVDITTMVVFLSELTLEIATVYNREPSTEASTKEAFWVLSSCFGVEAATVGISKVAIINASKKVLSVLIKKLLSIIGGWLAKGILLRMIPLVGSIVNASINMSACKQVGKESVLWYKTNPEQDSMWDAGKGKKEDYWEDEGTDETSQDLPDENIVLEPMNDEEVREEEKAEKEPEVIPPEEEGIEDIHHIEDIIEIPEKDVIIEDIPVEEQKDEIPETTEEKEEIPETTEEIEEIEEMTDKEIEEEKFATDEEINEYIGKKVEEIK